MTDLVKRIDDFLGEFGLSTKEWDLLNDCRAEIELLSQVNESLRNQNTALDEKLAEYSERKYVPPDGHIIVPTCAVRKKPYVPMTDDEISQMMQDWYNDTSDETSLPRFIETAVIKRAGLEIKHD